MTFTKKQKIEILEEECRRLSKENAQLKEQLANKGMKHVERSKQEIDKLQYELNHLKAEMETQLNEMKHTYEVHNQLMYDLGIKKPRKKFWKK